MNTDQNTKTKWTGTYTVRVTRLPGNQGFAVEHFGMGEPFTNTHKTEREAFKAVLDWTCDNSQPISQY